MKSCLLCGNHHFTTHSYPQLKISLLMPLEEIVVCQNCGFGVATPVPDEKKLQQFYESGNYWSEVQLNKGYQLHCLNQSLNRLHLIERDMNLKSKDELVILDVGAGPGHMLRGLKEKFAGRIQYYYIEPDEKCISAINQLATDQVKVSQYVEGINKDFDLIVINHVIEHVQNPVNFLMNFLEKIKPHGMLYIETPNSDYRFKSDVFPHTLFFMISTLEKLAKMSQYELLSHGVFGSDLIYRSDAKSKFKMRVLNKISHLALKFKIYFLVSLLDKSIYDYRSSSNRSVWLYGNFKRRMVVGS